MCEAVCTEDEHDDSSRRSFLRQLAAGTGILAGASAFGPLLDIAARSTAGPGPGAKGPAIATDWRAESFTTRAPTLVHYRAGAPDAWRTPAPLVPAYVIVLDGKLLILSTTCPHLACRVTLCPGAAMSGETGAPAAEPVFCCPCHGSRFNRYGVNIAPGPATRPLAAHHYSIRDGRVHLHGVFARETNEWRKNPNPPVDPFSL
ncbi:MAG: Rieske 2Fe-2S domain-containing protein [Firmicutes bacterium]|nr:Rieske 2Fe-2S domain-containing protein [Bacillota bacterium]